MTSSIPAVGTRTADGATLQAVFLDLDGTLVDTEASGGRPRPRSSPNWATYWTTTTARSSSAGR